MARILIVDDTNIGRLNIRKAALNAGHEIAGEAENGLQALGMYAQFKPDLVTMDITMPVMDGLSSLKKILQSDPQAKVIMVSALGQQLVVVDCIKYGARHFIVKPFKEIDLLKVIDEVLNPETPKKSGSNDPEIREQQQETVNEEEFWIENTAGTFSVHINRSFNEEHLNKLTVAASGMIYMRPLKVWFKFGDIESASPSVLEKLNEIIGRLKAAHGEVQVTVKNQKFREYLQTIGLEY